jgi:hypothetical protein
MDELIKFMFDRNFEGPSIERPTDEQEVWSIAERLQWFATSAASNFVKANSKDADVVAVFGFARALANGYAFIARNSAGGKATHYIGYESSIVINPGTLLLDATADIDGVVQLCPWRVPQEAPCMADDHANRGGGRRTGAIQLSFTLGNGSVRSFV